MSYPTPYLPAQPPSRPPSRWTRFLPVFALLGVMWVLEILDAILPGDWDLYGIHPRNSDGLFGVFLSPLLHAGFRHLMANSVPFLVLGCLVAIDGARRFWAVTGIVTVVAGLGVWLISPSATVTIGASSLVFGYLGYLVVNGIQTRRARDILVALGVLLLYGSSLLGAVPWLVGPGVSWQGHLFGAIGGGLAAWWLAPTARVS